MIPEVWGADELGARQYRFGARLCPNCRYVLQHALPSVRTRYFRSMVQPDRDARLVSEPALFQDH
jgi:hypothetical protein